MVQDVIIIGGGLGVLVAGATLAKAGKRVMLIEQHSIVGGCATTFKRKDFTVEVGLHEIDGLYENDVKRKIFDELDVFNEVEFVRVPEFYRFTNGRVDIVIPDNPEEAVKVLIERFPEETDGIKKFFHTIENIYREIDSLPSENWKMKLMLPVFPLLYRNIFFNLKKTVGDFIDAIINNEDLKLVLIANIGYFHDDPHTMSLIFFAIAQFRFYQRANYIKGGSQQLSNHLANVIQSNGGEVLTGQLVIKIIIENGKATGVKYKRTFDKDTEEKVAYANTIIANAAIPNIPEMLPPREKNILQSKIKGLKTSCSLLSIYIGFKKPLKELGNRHYSTFRFDENVKKLRQFIEIIKNTDFNKRGFVFVDYGQIESGLTGANKSLGVITTIDYLSNWENLTNEEYRKKKEEVAQIFLNKLERLVPGSKNEIEFYEVGTPKTIRRYTKNPEGTPYGYDQIPQQANVKRIDHKSPIDNLYFASAWTNPGGGFTGAILAGYFCAKTILDNIN